MTKREMLRNLIKDTNGAFFSITWIMKNRKERTMTVRDGVEKYLAQPKGVGSNCQEHCSYLITLFDVKDCRYKSVNLDTIKSLKCGNKIVWAEKEA